uniref:Uncharacterized protein n=1 Tax=Anguilla anguilla TaxID=7936 RepID=A0A0E9QBM0_ANGAN
MRFQKWCKKNVIKHFYIQTTDLQKYIFTVFFVSVPHIINVIWKGIIHII